ncbi:MAG: hopanoid biosynthesis-associated protein HpnK [Acidobacteriota bacterium]|nr:hopanoid biosynthesis-associated protein HpnK [Acidobacteriota bacterium]
MRSLIVTGDDFGSSADVNGAIVDAHRRGVLTAASLMVTGSAAEEAVALARENPTLAVGLHLVLVDGRAALPAGQVPNLVGPGGLFPRSPLRAGLRYRFSAAARSELRLEIREQLERFRRTGLRLAHLDGHHHLHLHPAVLDVLLELAEEFQIPAIRLPAEELDTAFALDKGRLNRIRNAVWSPIFRALRRRAELQLAAAGVGFADRVYGLFATGAIDEAYLLRLLPRMRGARVELYAHPSLAAGGGGRAELEALLSRRVRDAIRENGFRLAGRAERDAPRQTAFGVPQ